MLFALLASLARVAHDALGAWALFATSSVSIYHRLVPFQGWWPPVRVVCFVAGAIVATGILLLGAGVPDELVLDREAERWVNQTLDGMTLDERIGQLLLPSFRSTFTSSDSDTYDALVTLVHEYHVGGFHLFGGREPAPAVLLNPTYGTSTLGQPLAAASLVNRLQAIAPIPLLNTADFEAGVGFRLTGSTTFPRAMAFGAVGDERLAFEAGRITAVEGRAIGVHLNFAPVVDVNNNPRNPVINTRAFGEDPSLVGRLAAAYVRGLRAGGMLATVKHFPGHGDTDVDSHVGLPIITHPRDRLDRVELPPFRAGIAAGASAVMTGHIALPALDPQAGVPTTLSHTIVTGLLRKEMGFDGLIYTDSMRMRAVSERLSPGEAAAAAIGAGNDVVLHSPDDAAAFAGIRSALARGELDEAQVNASVERILRAKASLGLHRVRAVNLESIPVIVGSRAHGAAAREVSERSITLIKDERNQVPWRLPRDAALLYLSVLDSSSGWGVAGPSRTFIPDLKQRWPNVTAIELSDLTSPSAIELVRETAPRYDGIIAAVFVRPAAFSDRMDLSPALVQLLQALSRVTAVNGQAYVAVFFGSPYTAALLPELPAMMLTYDFYDLAERSAVRALAGESSIQGRLPIALSSEFPVGHGLERRVARSLR